MEKIEAPTLFKAFYKIKPKSFDYCCVCLRTSAERRLVAPRIFSKFIQAICLEYDLNENNRVCFLCERQASVAYKFYKAAMFSNSVKHFLKDYLDKRKVGTSELFEKKRFQRLFLKKRQADRSECEKLEDQLESQLQRIRTRSQLLQTEVLVIDSVGPHRTSPGKSSLVTQGFSEVYIVPDEPDELDELMQRLSKTSGHVTPTDKVILIDEDEDSEPTNQLTPTPRSKIKMNANQISVPKLVPIQKLIDTTINSITDPWDPTSTLAPSVDRSLATLIGSTTPAPVKTTQMQLATSTDGHSTKINIAPSAAAPENFILHPIVLDVYGNLTVPSLSANLRNKMVHIRNDNVLSLNGTSNLNLNNMFNATQAENNSDIPVNLQIPNHSFNLQLPRQNNLTDTSQMNQHKVAENAVKTEANNTPEAKTQSSAHHLQQISDLVNEIRSEVEYYNTMNQKASLDVVKNGGAKSVINNFGIKRSCDLNSPMQDVHSIDAKKKRDMRESEKEPIKRNDRIDWEDKIPMDVISFVDAVDPNADKILNGTPPEPQCEISDVWSLNPGKREKPRKNVKNASTTIIDLC